VKNISRAFFFHSSRALKLRANQLVMAWESEYIGSASSGISVGVESVMKCRLCYSVGKPFRENRLPK